MLHTRAHIQFNTATEVQEFVSTLNSDGTAIKYVIENEDTTIRINARSMLGVLYMMTEHNADMYFTVDDSETPLPNFIDKYRVL